MTFDTLAARSGVSVPTAKRVVGRRIGTANFANVVAVAGALGVHLGVNQSTAADDVDAMIRARARDLAERATRLVQGTSALESQALDARACHRMTERTYHELLAGPRRRLWER